MFMENTNFGYYRKLNTESILVACISFQQSYGSTELNQYLVYFGKLNFSLLHTIC